MSTVFDASWTSRVGGVIVIPPVVTIVVEGAFNVHPVAASSAAAWGANAREGCRHGVRVRVAGTVKKRISERLRI